MSLSFDFHVLWSLKGGTDGDNLIEYGGSIIIAHAAKQFFTSKGCIKKDCGFQKPMMSSVGWMIVQGVEWAVYGS